ncbi:hypothetical protein [Cryobacterium psychrophilum]|uniref:Uncharacterized protein n=1 Tax=Cryobacterium psychrophilum TaxID=41988 RepID=A0A4Y8KU69_9MICO|nr:hypothetical protein [Cryobacterium psychrophilum]TDW28510.1 hypothetical protein EDD25_0134 [Cryobacterium psychrophilum]TFD80488.1 hypothetical protein E3T53_05275 [Cryobacterium psychrophilum]
MPWWSWLLIWTGAVLLLLGTLTGLGIVLYRKLMRTADALQDLGDQLAALERGGTPGGAHDEPRRFRPAVFVDAAELRVAVESASVGQRHRAQLRRDRLITRGKLMLHAQMIQRTKPHVR